MKKYYLKQYDEVYVGYDKFFFQTTVLGFYCYGMKTPHGLFPFVAYSFYSCAYSNNTRFIVVSKKWHYKIAIILNVIRRLKFRIW